MFLVPVRPRCLLALVAVAIACGGESESPVAPTTVDPPGMRLVSGALGSDTVQAILKEPLTVEVSNTTGPVAGLPVAFERIAAPGNKAPTLTLSKVGEEVIQSSMTVMTDAQGHARVSIRLGVSAGDDFLRVTCAACNRIDTLRYGVTSGKAALVVASVRDTNVIIGDSYILGAVTYDRFGNPRTDPVTFASGSPLATVDTNGVVQVGGSEGRGAIAVRSGALTDSARFVVLTGPTIAAVMQTRSDVDLGGAIVTTTLNGLRERILTYTGFEPAYPVPSPTADLVAYQRAAVGMHVFLVDGSGQNRRLVAPGRFIETLLPRFSADGRFVYFAARDSVSYGIWRTGVDGAELTLVAPSGYGAAAPSPDGTSLAYSRSDGMVILSLVTGSERLVGPAGSFPVFSPDGGRLAWLTGYDDLVVVNADGSSMRRFGTVLGGTSSGLAWLGMGDRLIARGGSGVIALDARTGDRTPLPKLGGYYQLFARP